MSYKAKNNAFSTLAASLTDVATTLIVQTGHGDRFPVIAAPDETYITLEDSAGNREIVKVTERVAAADTMTIVRGQEGSVAQAWSAGAVVELRMTAALLERSINTVDDHMTDSTDAHDASAISVVPTGNMGSSNVQAALEEHQSELDGKELSINAATAKTTPVDADTMGLIDSAASNVLKKVTWANIKATLKAYFDTFYATITNLALKADLASPTFTGTPAAPTAANGTNTTQIATTAFVLANGGFASGTRMPFNQTAAPTGWTKDTTAALNDSIMRIVTGTVSNGGSTAFSSFNGQTSVGATTLTQSQIPSHTHTQDAHNHAYQIGNATAGATPYASISSANRAGITAGPNPPVSSTTATNQNTGGGGSHTHTITTGIKYNDFIIASKD